MLRRPLDRHPGADFLLVLQDPSGSLTGAVHQGRVLDADQAEALRRAHPWELSGGAGGRGDRSGRTNPVEAQLGTSNGFKDGPGVAALRQVPGQEHLPKRSGS